MNALVYHGPQQMHWEEWQERAPEPGEALVAVRAVGICGSDLHGYTGERWTAHPADDHGARGDRRSGGAWQHGSAGLAR